MTRAAQELCVTHGAISKQMQALEEELGMPLLRRLARTVEPTAEGKRLAVTLGAAFSLIETGVEQLRPGPLAVSCSASIMMRWLIPRLGRFRQLYPDIELRISADHGPLDLLREGVGIAIRNDVVKPPQDVIVRPLMREWVGPVCSPEYLAQCGVQAAEKLVNARLLGNSSRNTAWLDWWTSASVQADLPATHEIYEHFYLVLHAAACGHGFAMAPRFLVEDDLQAGRLVAPFGFVEGNRNLVLWLAPHVRTRQDISALANWLKEEFVRTQAAIARHPIEGAEQLAL